MKSSRLIICFVFMLLSALLHAQKNNPKNQKEMEERAKEMLKDYDKLTPGQKKMLEQMGIKLPDLSKNPAMNAANAAEVNMAMQIEMTGIPQKDMARIKNISSTALTNASMAAYIANAFQKVSAKLKPAAKQEAEKIYTELKSKAQSPAAIGNAACIFWAIGRLEIGVHLMGKALTNEPTNTDNQNNYASMLTQLQAETIAIPILNKLNKQFRSNSTVLNNLGQAWFGLGDLDMADKYLDSAIRIFPFHPQANFTKSFIEENKGNTAKAIDLVKKSMQSGVSQDKQNRLSKLGYQLLYTDIPLPFKPNPDPLGLYEFKHPEFPKNAEEEKALRESWTAWNKKIEEMAVAIQQKLNKYVQPAAESGAKTGQELVEAYNKGGMAALKATSNNTVSFGKRAELKLKLLREDNAFQDRWRNAEKALEHYRQSKEALANDYHKKYKKLDYKQALQTGAGQANSSMCQDFTALVTGYYQQVDNTTFESLYDNYLKHLRIKLNEEIFWKQFVMMPQEFEAEVLRYQMQWLSALLKGTYIGYYEQGSIKVTAGNCVYEKKGKQGGKLQEFRPLNCTVSELSLPIGNIRIECGKMTSSLSLGPVKFGLMQDMNQAGNYENFLDDFKSCNIEITAGKKFGETKLGPVSAEIGAEAGIGMEIGRNGIEDVYVTAGAKAGVGTHVMDALEKQFDDKYSSEGIGVSDRSISVGAEARVSLISGKSSFSGPQLKGLGY